MIEIWRVEVEKKEVGFELVLCNQRYDFNQFRRVNINL